GAKPSHCPEKLPLARCEPVEANTEKALVESFNHNGRGRLNNPQGDGRSWSAIPSLITPFLEKVRVALRQPENFSQRSVFEIHACCSCRLAQRLSGVWFGERANGGEGE